MRNKKEGYNTNIGLHTSKQQDKQINNNYQNKKKNKTIIMIIMS